ncbi:hypothetical protein HDU79_007652 [Rhizoclosmatium sp. JEL0117]|nr:hypothetical protein HDU79_007652 [Rhizoclosmatium sp. JEL0117]
MSFSFAPTPIAPLQGLQKPVLSGFGASRDRKRKGFDEDDCMDESELSWDIQSKRINSNSMDSPSLATAQVPPLFSSTGTSTPYLPPTPSASDVWLSHSDLLAQQTQLDVNMTMMMTDDDQEIDSDATLSDVSSYYNHLSRHQNQQRQAAQLSRGDCALCKSGAGGVPPPPVAAVPLAAGVPAVPGPIAAADGNSKVKPQNWKDRYEKIKGGIDKYIPKGKDKSKPKEKVGKDVNEKEPFEDFKEGRDSVAKEETNKEVQRDQTERNTAESKFSTE